MPQGVPSCHSSTLLSLSSIYILLYGVSPMLVSTVYSAALSYISTNVVTTVTYKSVSRLPKVSKCFKLPNIMTSWEGNECLDSNGSSLFTSYLSSSFSSPLSPPLQRLRGMGKYEYSEEDPGYHSSDSPVAGDSGCYIEKKSKTFDESVVKIESTYDSEETRQEITVNYIESIIDVKGESDGPSSSTEKTKAKEGTRPNPLMAQGVHRDLWCCTNGHFRVISETFSEFESNCGCTTRSLVDWSTRLVWINRDLRHQYKISEVTHLSPYRTSQVIPRPLLHSWQREPTSSLTLPPHLHPLTSSRELLGAEETPTNIPATNIKQEASEASQSSEEERPFVCEEAECGRTFCRNEELTRHLRIHSGHRPFLCQDCGRGFVRRDHLTKHLRTHLPSHAKRTYACPLPVCTHRYTRSDALTRHMWTAHHIRARQPPRPHARTRTSHTPTPPPFSTAHTDSSSSPTDSSSSTLPFSPKSLAYTHTHPSPLRPSPTHPFPTPTHPSPPNASTKHASSTTTHPVHPVEPHTLSSLTRARTTHTLPVSSFTHASLPHP